MDILINQTAVIFIMASIFSILLATGTNAHGKTALLTALPELAFIGMYVGLVIMLGNMSQPADVPLSLAICCLPALYVFVVYLIITSTNVNTDVEDPQSRYKQRSLGAMIFVLALAYVTSENYPAFLDTFTIIAVAIFLLLVVSIQKVTKEFNSRKTRDLLPAIGMVIGAIGSIVALANIDDPKSIGPALAVAYLGVIYVSVIRVLWLILQPTNEIENPYERVFHFAHGRFLLPIITVAILLISFQFQQ